MGLVVWMASGRAAGNVGLEWTRGLIGGWPLGGLLLSGLCGGGCLWDITWCGRARNGGGCGRLLWVGYDLQILGEHPLGLPTADGAGLLIEAVEGEVDGAAWHELELLG